jgi:hypothetical protein
MEAGDRNANGQELVEKTSVKSASHPFARVWRMRCSQCGGMYGCNSCDAHVSRCPRCGGGAPGEPQ